MKEHQELLRLLNEADTWLEEMYERIAKRHELSYTELMIFYHFSLQSHVSQKTVVEALHLSKSTVHSIILRLEKRGYLSFGPLSGKEKPLSLTPEGKRKAQEVLKDTHEEEEKVLWHLGEENTRNLKEISACAIRYFKGEKK